jgi:hypothetical protein
VSKHLLESLLTLFLGLALASKAQEPGKGAPIRDAAAEATLARDAARLQSPEGPGPRPGPRGQEPIDQLLFSEDESGTIWVRGRDYKASFSGDAVSFIPFLGSAAPRNYPVTFRLASARAGGTPIPIERPDRAVRSGDSILIDHGSVTEIYALSLDGFEQMFRFDAAPGAGDLVIRIAVETELGAASAADSGYSFENERGGVRYGRVEAFDVTGGRASLASLWNDGAIEIVVPAGFKDSASFPLTVDPVVSTFTVAGAQFGPSAPVWINADVAYDVSTDLYLTVQEYVYSATDHDVYYRLHDASGAPIGSYGTIDATTSNFAKPKVANNNLANEFLVVCERTLPGGATVVSGRTVTPGPAGAGPTFQINGSDGGRNPDVGGDPGLSAPTYYCVCWEGGFGGFSNIYYNMVQPGGLVNFPGSTLLGFAPTVTYDTRPSISKSNGNNAALTQNWIIVFERLGPSGDKDIYGAMIHWDG